MIVTGGSRYEHAWYFGGRIDGLAPTGGTGDLLYRFGRSTSGIWDPLIEPVAADPSFRPSPREGLTAVDFRLDGSDAGGASAFFGGMEGNGTTIDRSVYLLTREDGNWQDADYTYRWTKLPVSETSLPPARSDHVALNLGGSPTSAMAIYGGLSKPSGGPAVVLDDFWRLSKSGSIWAWSPLPTSGGPGPRYGHAAVTGGSNIYVFGGTATPNDVPSDDRVYKFTLPNGPWEILPVSGTPPVPRRDHTMVLAGTSLLIYGGYTETAPSSSALYRLDLAPSTPAWSTITTGGPSPGPRANHAAFYEASLTGPKLTLFGGEPPTLGDPAVDNRVYTINPFPSAGGGTWVQGPASPHGLSGHAVVRDQFGTLHARIPETYNPSTSSWAPQTGSGWMPPGSFIGDYTVQFLVPGSSIPGAGGRLLRLGRDPAMRYLDVPATGLAGAWAEVANGHGGSFEPLTGVQYRPGKILAVDGFPVSLPSQFAKTFDALSIGTATWTPQPGLVGDTDPDLLVLPNGRVLYVGYCPQIWNPDNGTWTTGGANCGLATVPVGAQRAYHSSAMLLPDGKVLTSNWTDNGLRVYCPHYLFDANNSHATRPEIISAPASIVYGEAFVIGKLATDQIGSACLIRPAAVTHSFDQNGRYVPLTFQTLPDGSGLQTWAPTDGSVAPPGDYMLFILNTQGVPAIAKWIHLGDCAQVPCDAGSPPTVTDMYADIVGPNEVWMVWSAPGDDRTPLAGSYDLRNSTSAIANDLAYAAATPLSGEPAVQPQGTSVNYTAGSLTECTQYHFALKTRDGISPSFKNWSLLGNTVTVTTTCGGGPGGGSRAERVDEGRVAGGASARAVGSSKEAVAPEASASSGADAYSAGLAALSSLDAGSGVLEAETHRTREGGWQVTLRRLAEAEGVQAADRDAIVSQVREAAGGWRTLGRYRPTPGGYPLGLCALRDNGRVVFPAGYAVDQVVPGLRSRGEECAMSGAAHSRSGAMGGPFLAEGGAVELRLGDVLTLTYAPAGTRPGNEMSAYLQVRSSGQAAAPASATGRRLGATLPTSFALHQNQPNPFDGSTTIDFDLPVTGAVRLEVFDLLGRRVATLAQGEYPAGNHTVAWDLRDAGGAPVRAGVYVYRLQSGTFSARRKLSVVP